MSDTMKYCKKCKKISFSDGERCVCGKAFAKKFDDDAPVVLISVGNDKKVMAEEALIKADIPFSRKDNYEYSPAIGKYSETTDLLIPLSFLKKGLETLEQDGIAEKPEWFGKLDLPDNPEWEEMPRGKQTAVRAVSFVLFLVLIYFIVTGVDIITAFIGKLFS